MTTSESSFHNWCCPFQAALLGLPSWERRWLGPREGEGQWKGQFGLKLERKVAMLTIGRHWLSILQYVLFICCVKDKENPDGKVQMKKNWTKKGFHYLKPNYSHHFCNKFLWWTRNKQKSSLIKKERDYFLQVGKLNYFSK